MMSFATADLYDANENNKNIQVALPLFRSYGKKKQFKGQVVTLKCHEDNTLVGDILRKEDGTGKVLVVDGGGSLRCALVGDNIALAAIKNKWEGIIVYGCIRDATPINEMEIGIRALGTNPTKTIKRNTGVQNESVNFANVNFENGSYVYVDEDGILISNTDLLP